MKKLFWALFGTALIFTIPAFAQQGPSNLPGCVYNATPPTLTDKQQAVVQCDTNAQLKISGSISATSTVKSTAAAPTYVEGSTNPISSDLSGGLRITGTINATSAATATAAAPSYVEGTANPVSQNLLGDQRVIAKQSGAWTVSGTGTAGTAATGVVTVQGIASMTKLLVTPDSVALPANQSVNVSQINGVTPLMGAGNTGTGSPRVTIASDSAGVIALGTAGSPPGGTSVITMQGAASMTPILVTPVPQAATGGTTLATLTLAASTNATNVKASAGQLYSISGFNMSSATPIWISLYNNAGTPTCGTNIIQQFLIPGNTTGTGFVYDFATPKSFGTGIAFCATTGIAGTGNAAATTYVLNIDYK